MDNLGWEIGRERGIVDKTWKSWCKGIPDSEDFPQNLTGEWQTLHTKVLRSNSQEVFLSTLGSNSTTFDFEW